MHPNCIEPDLDYAKNRIKQLEGLKKIKDEKYGTIFIKYFEKFSPFEIKHQSDYGCFVTFNHALNFQATEGAFEEFAKRTGLIPTGWWYDEKDHTTTIAFDRVFYPKSSALVDSDPHCVGCIGECTCFGA